jgi:glycosyltransferase involved in cell wall biosynthesis
MGFSNTQYHLVHIITDNEYKTPVVGSQVFDRAQVEAETKGEGKPLSVSVWIVEPMRELLKKRNRGYIKSFKKRSPDVKVSFIGGINRLKNWPVTRLMRNLRASLGDSPVIYHCRGESSFQWANQIKELFKDDKIVLDVRGFWPLERLANNNVYDITTLNALQKEQYDADVDALKFAVKLSDHVTTVSGPLKEYLVDQISAPKEPYLIPCCVKNIVEDSYREQIRDELNIRNKKAILYLGGVQKYQHLEDMVLPFIKTALSISTEYVGVFISQNASELQNIVRKFHLDENRVRIISVSQDEVGKYLSAMDVGLLLRAPSLLNTFSQPVKLGEYLSAGVPVIVENGTGAIPAILAQYNIGTTLSLVNKKGDELYNEVRKVLAWLENDFEQKRVSARSFVKDNYTWAANLSFEREMYMNTLEKNIVEKV